jgi:hypothetical protein
MEAPVNLRFKIVGIYKDPKFSPWSSVDPEKEVKILWGRKNQQTYTLFECMFVDFPGWVLSMNIHPEQRIIRVLSINK